jgi:hypothetical protein
VHIARCAKSSIAVVVAMLACGCGSATSEPAPAPTDTPTATATALVSPMNDRSRQTAWSVVRALSRAGLVVTNPLDTTAHECPAAGCLQSVVTDQLRVKSFASSAAAMRFASARGLHHVGTVVVAFAPPLSPADRSRYWAAITAAAI